MKPLMLDPPNAEIGRTEEVTEPGTSKKTGNEKDVWKRFVPLNRFVDLALRQLAGHGAEIAVWICLYRDTKPDGFATAGQKDLATRCGISDRAVRKAIDRLLEMKLLRIVRRGRTNQPSRYQILAFEDDGNVAG